MYNSFHFGGHETFPLRYTWLPRATSILQKSHAHFTDDLKMITELGIGKNMARSVRHWMLSTGMADRSNNGKYKLTSLAKQIFSEDGDMFLERMDTIWILHYEICKTPHRNALWYYLFNVFTGNRLIKDEVLRLLEEWLQNFDDVNPARKTLERDLSCCINMYAKSHLSINQKDIQNLLASPMKDLGLITTSHHAGEYKMQSTSEDQISDEAFTYCLLDYLSRQDFPSSMTIEQLLFEEGSPARIFRMTEEALEVHLERFERKTGKYSFDSTAGVRQIFKTFQNQPNLDLYLKRAIND